MAVELRLRIKWILEQISSCLFMILNKHTRQGDKNVLLLCVSFCVVLNNLLQCHRRIINLLKLEVKIWRSLKGKEKPFFTKTASFTWRREWRLYREDKDSATSQVFLKRCDSGEYSLRIKIWWAVCKRSAWWNINKLPSLNYHYSLCLSAESCLQNKKIILLYFRPRKDGNNLIGKVNLSENRPVKLCILFYGNADKIHHLL